jgi:universal stress protein A
MLPFKRILCPTDFSTTSYDALNAAAELALFFQAELTVMHVVPPAPVIASAMNGSDMTIAPANLPDQTRREAEMTLAEVAHDRVPHEVDLHLMVVEGEPARAILEAAEQRAVDAVVIATQGRTGWRRFLFGSVAERVVRCAACSVLTIHGERARVSPGEPKADKAVEV